MLDRAGVTGDDGASHNGMWDMSILSVVPGLRLAAPRDGVRLRELLREAVDVARRADGGPLPEGRARSGGPGPRAAPTATTSSPATATRTSWSSRWARSPRCASSSPAGSRDQGIGVTVVDPRWVIPVPHGLAALAARHRLVVTVEDNVRTGGVGAAVSQSLRDRGVFTPVRDVGIPRQFLDHGTRAQVMSRIALTAQDVAREVVGAVARLDAARAVADAAAE